MRIHSHYKSSIVRSANYACFVNKVLRNHSNIHPLFYILSSATFMLQQSWVLVVPPSKIRLNRFDIWPFIDHFPVQRLGDPLVPHLPGRKINLHGRKITSLRALIFHPHWHYIKNHEACWQSTNWLETKKNN